MKRPARDLVLRLNAATVHLVRALRQPTVRPALAHEHRSALSIVVSDGPIRVGELARSERVTAPTMTSTVDALQRAGLVRRTADPADSRAVLIEATAAGRRVVQRGVGLRLGRIAETLEALSREDRERVLGAVPALERLARLLEDDETA